MPQGNPTAAIDKPESVGAAMHKLVSELYPICRSITGDGVRQTLKRIQEIVPIQIHEVPSGTQVLDWTVPNEWNVNSARLVSPTGETIVDFARHTLHLLNYSVPKKGSVSLKELEPHLFSLPDKPDLFPYRTSYYNENWGFCLPHKVREKLSEGMYHVEIDTTLKPGALTYGEFFIPGTTNSEVLLSCHVCHPSLANDNLSGIALCTWLANWLMEKQRRYSYRILFIPGTIGAITWLARNKEKAGNISHGLVVANVGDKGHFHYKKSRIGAADIDRLVQILFRDRKEELHVRDFSPYGYDERQYCSSGFNLPVGSLTRSPHGTFPEYHTSADNLSFVTAASLAGSLEVYQQLMECIEANRTYINLSPFGEPQLGKRGLYRAMGGLPDAGAREMAMLWTLNLSDGINSTLDIAERSGERFGVLTETAKLLVEHDLLREQEK